MSALHHVERVLLILLVLFVPVSATPLLPFGSGTLVRPLSIVPAVLLLTCLGIRFYGLGQRLVLWPRDGSSFLIAFTGYAVLSGLLSVAGAPDELFKGQTPVDSFVRGILTLVAGVIFYVAGRCYISSADDIKLVQRWLWIGLTGSIALAAVQVAAIVEGGETLRTVQAITDLFAVHYDGLATRAQGMTFEPSWLANQIIIVLMPMLVARSISRQRFVASPRNNRELLGALPGFAVVLAGLLCAGSRFGLAAATALIIFGALLAAWRGRLAAAFSLLLLIAAGVGGIAAMSGLNSGAGGTYVTGGVQYLITEDTTILQGSIEQQSSDVVQAIAIVGRVAAAQSAFNIWLVHPVFGVSLGNDFRYFRDYAPDWAFATSLFRSNAREGLGWVDPYSPEKGNAKNLVLRLLAETGIVGLILFGAFFLRQTLAYRARDPYFACFRLSTVVALLFGTLNGDSLADPVLWIPLVLCAAMGRLQAASSAQPTTR